MQRYHPLPEGSRLAALVDFSRCRINKKSSEGILEKDLMSFGFYPTNQKEIIKEQNLDDRTVNTVVRNAIKKKICGKYWGDIESAADLIIGYKLTREDVEKIVKEIAKPNEFKEVLKRVLISLIESNLTYNTQSTKTLNALVNKYQIEQEEFRDAAYKAISTKIINEQYERAEEIAKICGLSEDKLREAILRSVTTAIENGLYEDAVEFHYRDLVGIITSHYKLSKDEIKEAAQKAHKKCIEKKNYQRAKEIVSRYKLVI